IPSAHGDTVTTASHVPSTTEAFQFHHGSHTSAKLVSPSPSNCWYKPVPTCPSVTAVHTAPAAAALSNPAFASFHSASAYVFTRSARAVAIALLVSSNSLTSWCS